MKDNLTHAENSELVGPVLESSEKAQVVISAIRQLNQAVTIQDHGSYLRVLTPKCCRVTRDAIEHALGCPFHLPTELEQMMPSFKGIFTVSEEEAIWAFKQGK